jgi:hypothetical protein
LSNERYDEFPYGGLRRFPSFMASSTEKGCMKEFETLRHSNKRIRFRPGTKTVSTPRVCSPLKRAAGNMFQRPAGLKIDWNQNAPQPRWFEPIRVSWWRGAQKLIRARNNKSVAMVIQ